MGSARGSKGVKNSFSRGVVAAVDGPILACLPVEGSMVGEIRPLALNASTIVKRLNGEVTGAEANGRLRTLAQLGYCVSQQLVPVSQGMGYQITAKGQQLLADIAAGKDV